MRNIQASQLGDKGAELGTTGSDPAPSGALASEAQPPH